MLRRSPFDQQEPLPLVYSEGGHLAPWPYYLHLFTPQAPVARNFELESGLPDWQLTVPVLGIVVTFDRKYDPQPPLFSWRGLKNSVTSATLKAIARSRGRGLNTCHWSLPRSATTIR